VPSLSRRGVLALALEQLSFELDEDKFQALAAARAASNAQSASMAGAAAEAVTAPDTADNAASPAAESISEGNVTGGGVVVRSSTELAAMFLELLLGEEKFFR